MDLSRSSIDRIRKISHGRELGMILLIIPAVIYLPGILGWIPFPVGENTYTDLLLSHYPYTLFLKKAILQDYTIPLWSNLIYSGAPFAANPLTGFWYPPGWIAMLFPLPAGISVVLALHAVFGSLGFYLFMREEGAGREVALLGGIAFGMMPKLNIHYGAGHISLIYAITWTPWLFWTGRKDRSGWKVGLAAAFLFLADPRWAVLAGVIWVSYTIAHRHLYGKKLLGFLVQAGIVAFLVGSPLVIPMLEYVQLSTRLTLTTAERLIFSLPLEKLVGLLFPGSGGNIEWFSYVGGLPLILFVILLLDPEKRRGNIFWPIWTIISILIAFGSYLPGAEIIAGTPPFSWLRVPARSLFLLGFCLAVITVKTLDWIKRGEINIGQIRLVSFGFLAASLILSLGIFILTSQVKLKSLWGPTILGISSLICFGTTLARYRKIWLGMMVALVVIDYCGVGYLNNAYKREKTIFEKSNEISSLFEKDKGTFRLYSPSYSVPQYIAALNGFELSDGVDPLQILNYKIFMDQATGIKDIGYSVSIPPFETGRPEVDNKGYQPDAYLLGLLNVKYLISDYEINGYGIELKEQYQDCYLYRNELYFPRAWILTQDISKEDRVDLSKINQVKEVVKKPNRISIQANGPGRLVISEVAYPGWNARINGEPAELSTVFGVIQAVELLPGPNQVEFRYQPRSIISGLILGFMGWGYCLYKLFKRDGDELPA